MTAPAMAFFKREKPAERKSEPRTMDDLPSFTPASATPEGAPSGDPFAAPFWQDAITRWTAQLPDHVRPVLLIQQYPRIAARLATLWNDPAGLGNYLMELLVDKRGGRRGFPRPVLADIVRLNEYVRVRHFGEHPKANSTQEFLATGRAQARRIF